VIDFDHAYGLWADTHVFFDHLSPHGSTSDVVDEHAAAWWKRMTGETPNGALLTRNAMFTALNDDRTLYLLHVTHAAESLTRHGSLYPSGGCLVGSIYCAPLTRTGSAFRMHNLGEYVLTKEAPAFTRKVGSADPTPLIIEVKIPPAAFRGLAGIDYLRLGDIHLQIFLHLEYLLSGTERHRLREAIVSRVRNGMTFLQLCNSLLYDGGAVDADNYLTALDYAITQLPILGYLYFETLVEYLMLHSTSPRTEQLREIGEFDNWTYKQMLFSTFPRMAGKFDLSKFRPSITDLQRLVEEICPTLNLDELTGYVIDRLSYLVNARLFTPELRPGDWQRLQWDFTALRPSLSPLLGHLVHRELRTFGRYPEFYFYFDQYKALQVWNYWNHMSIAAPFNGTFPKGEIGINPAYPDLKYRIWRGRLNRQRLLEPVEELDLHIVPRLVDIKYTLMRNNKWRPRGAPRIGPRRANNPEREQSS
jgi:hypothetical protein